MPVWTLSKYSLYLRQRTYSVYFYLDSYFPPLLYYCTSVLYILGNILLLYTFIQIVISHHYCREEGSHHIVTPEFQTHIINLKTILFNFKLYSIIWNFMFRFGSQWCEKNTDVLLYPIFERVLLVSSFTFVIYFQFTPLRNINFIIWNCI